MTKIKFFKNKDNLVGVECSGHTGYADFGKDVLCATLSGLVQSCYLGLKKVIGIKIDCSRDDNNGYIKYELPLDIESEKLSKSQILLETLKASIEDLIEGYSKYISMEVIEYVY